MITNFSSIPVETEYFSQARALVERGRALLIDAVVDWEAVLGATAWDSPAGREFFRTAEDARTATIALDARASGWSDELAWVPNAGICG